PPRLPGRLPDRGDAQPRRGGPARSAMGAVPHRGQLVPLARAGACPVTPPAVPVRAVLLDVDGTLVFAGRAIPGAVSTLSRLRDRGIQIRLLTNIDSRTPETVCRELATAGIEVPVEAVFTPVVAALRFLEQHPAERCHLLLSAELAARFAAHDAGPGRADYVLVGDCREVGGDAQPDAAFRPLTDGAPPSGGLRGGAGLPPPQRGGGGRAADGPSLDPGAFVALLEHASGQTA